MKIGFIGAGNMGSALARAVCKSVGGKQVVITDLFMDKARSVAAGLGAQAADIQQVAGTCQRIFDYVRQNPKSADELRKFMNYYLPTLEKLVKTYELMEEQGVEGENITASKERISQMLDTMDLAFEKQLDALFGDTALDIDTDITVMEGMMAQEGLTDAGKMPAPEEIKPLQEETFQAGDIKLEL